MQVNSKSKFNFTVKLKNQTGEKQVYALQSSPPRGSDVSLSPTTSKIRLLKPSQTVFQQGIHAHCIFYLVERGLCIFLVKPLYFFLCKIQTASDICPVRNCCMVVFHCFLPSYCQYNHKRVSAIEICIAPCHFFYEKLKFSLTQIMPNELFSEITSTLLMPSVRSLGPLTMEQVHGTIPGALPLGQSLMVVWPQLTGLIAFTLICFLLSYISFMRREIRS